MTQYNHVFQRIAAEHLLIPTLECRRADSLDFHTVSVWAVAAALQAAYNAGASDAAEALLEDAKDSDDPSFTSPQIEFLDERLELLTGSTGLLNLEKE